MARREWADKIVKQEMTGYHWNARIRKSTVILPDIAAKLLRKEHAMAVRIVQKIKRRHSNAQEDAIYSHGFTKACEDILKALKEGRA